MANEVFYSSSAHARLAETLNANVILKLADRSWGLWRHPSIIQLPDANGSGSSTIKTPIVSLGGVDSMAAVAENGSTSNTALGLTSFTVAIARQALQRQISDLNEIVDSTGVVSAEGLAGELVDLMHKRFVDLIAAAASGFTNTVGTTTVDMTVDDAYDATYQLEGQSVDGMLTALLYHEQYNNLRESARAETGASPFEGVSAELLAAKGPGYKGKFLDVDWYTSSLVPTASAGADSAGAMWGPGGMAFREGSRNYIEGVGSIRVATPAYAVLEYDGPSALTRIVHNYFVGVSIAEDLRGVAIVTDR